MKIETTAGIPLDSKTLGNYFRSLVNMFFKILPLYEEGEKSVGTYMRSLQLELLGCGGLIEALHDDSMFMSLVSILQYFIDNPGGDVSEVRREVFRAISLCNKLRERYTEAE